LIKDATSGLWNLAQPIKSTPHFQKVANASMRAANATKHAAMSGWKVVAPLAKHSANKTVGVWKYIAPKINRSANSLKDGTVSGWQYLVP
jgi:hypothetical protein